VSCGHFKVIIFCIVEIFNTINYSLSSRFEKQNKLEKITEVISCPLDDKSDKSGPDFCLDKTKSDMNSGGFMGGGSRGIWTPPRFRD
jgi:hypothetical protein